MTRHLWQYLAMNHVQTFYTIFQLNKPNQTDQNANCPNILLQICSNFPKKLKDSGSYVVSFKVSSRLGRRRHISRSKGYFRAGRAALEMEFYQEALEMFEKGLEKELLGLNCRFHIQFKLKKMRKMVNLDENWMKVMLEISNFGCNWMELCDLFSWKGFIVPPESGWGPAIKIWWLGRKRLEISEININRSALWALYRLIGGDLSDEKWRSRRSWWKSTPPTIPSLTVWFNNRKMKRMKRRTQTKKTNLVGGSLTFKTIRHCCMLCCPNDKDGWEVMIGHDSEPKARRPTIPTASSWVTSEPWDRSELRDRSDLQVEVLGVGHLHFFWFKHHFTSKFYQSIQEYHDISQQWQVAAFVFERWTDIHWWTNPLQRWCLTRYYSSSKMEQRQLKAMLGYKEPPLLGRNPMPSSQIRKKKLQNFGFWILYTEFPAVGQVWTVRFGQEKEPFSWGLRPLNRNLTWKSSTGTTESLEHDLQMRGCSSAKRHQVLFRELIRWSAKKRKNQSDYDLMSGHISDQPS